jgi:hypothetical protein
MSNAMNERSNSGMGATALVLLVLSFLVPSWAARILGLAGPHAHLLDWMMAQEGVICLILWLAYGIAGFCILLAIAVAIGGTGLALLWGLRKLKAWALRASVALAGLLGLAMLWVGLILGELLWDAYATQVVRLAQWRYEQRELRRLYREEYAADFPSYRAFLRFYRAVEKGEDPNAQRGGNTQAGQAAPDPVEAAMRLLGLPEEFTKADLQRRFRTLIKGVHPDVVGPNELATQLNDANALIKERKGWL